VGAPRNTAAEIGDKLDKEINAGLADPKLKGQLSDVVGYRRHSGQHLLAVSLS
jgi:hypothetical protein